MNGFVSKSPKYDIEKLREVYGGGYDRGYYDDEDEGEDEPDPNYKCQYCQETRYVEDHMRTAPAYCTHCEKVRSHIRLDAIDE